MLMYGARVYAYRVTTALEGRRLEGMFPEVIPDEYPMIYVIQRKKLIGKYELKNEHTVTEKYGCDVWDMAE